ncbi:MAG: Na+/H+ antiporter subunit E [Caldilineaceae bacterium]|nr:Na+/H+ antiporter subunit E [Caldilineaceae bacterium]
MSNNRRKRNTAGAKRPKPSQQPTPKQQAVRAKSTTPTEPTSVFPSTFPLPAQNLYLVLFLVNIIVAFFWQLLVPIFGPLDYLIGFLLGFIAIVAFHRPYGRRAYYLLYFALYVLWEIVLSNLSIAKLVLQPKPHLDPGIIGIPLTVTSGLEITILASVITLTPGTISVDLGHNADGQRVLYVHNLTVGDPEAFRRSVKDGFERLLLRATQGQEVRE